MVNAPATPLVAGFRAVKHDLLNHTDAATIYVAGNAVTAEHLVLFCAGWPCDQTSFLPMAKRLVDAERSVLVGITCMPEYDRVGVFGQSPLKPEGYDFDEVASCYAQAVEALQTEASSSRPAFSAKPKLTLVVHDWGIVPGFCHSNTHGCDKMVVFDSLPADESWRPESTYCLLCQMTYQLVFALSFFFRRFNRCFGDLFHTAGLYCIAGIFAHWCSPVGPRDTVLTNTGEGAGIPMPPSFLCYPYYYMWSMVLFPWESRKKERVLRAMDFNRSLKKQPICFIYGKDKNTHFHSKADLEKLMSSEGSEVLEVSGTGHWCFKQEPEQCFEAVRRFVLA